jgi:hypothetical protein
VTEIESLELEKTKLLAAFNYQMGKLDGRLELLREALKKVADEKGAPVPKSRKPRRVLKPSVSSGDAD